MSTRKVTASASSSPAPIPARAAISAASPAPTRIAQALAKAAGAGNRKWRAYLSTGPGKPASTRRTASASGPWFNAKGVQVAANVADLHSDNNKLSKDNSLTEKGAVVNGRGDTPNQHDILTGSQSRRHASSGQDLQQLDEQAPMARPQVGHHDRQGGGANPTSWNSAHDSKGCSLEELRGSGGEGLLLLLRREVAEN